MYLAELEKLSFADAKQIVTDLDHAKGRLKEVAARNTWLMKKCQEAMREKFGNSFDVYRGVVLLDNKELKGDSVASTSLSVGVCLHMLANKASVYWQGRSAFQATNLVFMRYRLIPERVVLWVPYAMQYIRAAVGKRGNYRITNRHGGLYKIEQVLAWIEKWDEQEVVADLSGLSPKVLTFDTTVIGLEKLAWFKSWYEGKGLEQHQNFAKIPSWQFQDWTKNFQAWMT